MKPSLFLTVIGIVGNLAYGFSASPTPFAVSRVSNRAKMAPSAVQQPKNTKIRFPSRGGALKSTASADESSSPLKKAALFLTSLYGTGGVMYILIKAIRRVVPIALEPFAEGAVPMTTLELVSYVVTVAWFAYVEGYKGFQTKFSPLVVARSLTLEPKLSKIHHILLAPFYSMGLFHSTGKRMTVSWCVTIGVAVIVHAVKKLPYPWRNIVDAGVVAGLSWGCLSIAINYIKALVVGKSPADPVLPEPKK